MEWLFPLESHQFYGKNLPDCDPQNDPPLLTCVRMLLVGHPWGLGRSLDFLFCKYCPGFSYLFFTSNGSISQLLLIHYEMMFLSIINVVWHTQRLQIWWNWFAHWWYCSSVSFGNFTLQILTIVDELHYIQAHAVLVKHMQSLLCRMTCTKF